jgi:4-amino-4-deoxy-L-arabinose transferase-like glycosyltransferase
MKKDSFFLLALFLISFFLIFFRFNLIPKNISFDEIEFANLALSLNNKSYTTYSNMATGHSTLYFYILFFSFKLFGINNFALRFPSAIFGFLSIFIFYYLIKNLLNEKRYKNFFAFLCSVVLITSRWYFNFARFSFEATFLILLELISILFLIKYFKINKIQFLIYSGIFSGLSFLSYTSGRIFFLLPLLVLFIKKTNWRNYLYFLISFLIVSIPLISYLFTNNDIRVKEASIFSQNMSLKSKLFSVTENVKKTSFMFFLHGDMNGRHNYPGKPTFNPILSVFFLIGLILSIKNYKEFNNKLMLFYFVLSITPTLFTKPIENPNMLRTFSALPSISYFILNALIYLSKIKIKINEIYLLSILSLLIFISSLYEIRTYFLFQSRVLKNSFEVKCNLQQIHKLKTNIIPKKCLVQKNEF